MKQPPYPMRMQTGELGVCTKGLLFKYPDEPSFQPAWRGARGWQGGEERQAGETHRGIWRISLVATHLPRECCVIPGIQLVLNTVSA